jgi:hypothetical protein
MNTMASIEDLVAGIQAALARVATARAQVERVAAPIEDAGRTYAQLGVGSQRHELSDSAAHLRLAYERCRNALAMLDHATRLADAYLATITRASGGPVEPSPGGQPARKPWQLTEQEVARLHGALPAPITTAERGTGRKTHGRWVGADGQVRSINSGKDGISRGALAWLLTQVHRPVSSSTHAEMKLAYYLRQMHERSGQPQHATIVVNNLVCKGPHSCATLLPVMLPAGCTLTVHAPNYRRTFTGGVRA